MPPPNPRKTPVQDRSSETVKAIKQAAAHILEETGFRHYTTNGIARRAGVSIGSLYQYFPNKDAITAEIVAEDARAFNEQVETAVTSHADATATELIDRLVAIATDHQLARPTLARLIDVAESQLDMTESLQGSRAQTAETIKRAFKVEVAQMPFSPDIVVQDIFAIARGIIEASSQEEEPNVETLNVRVSLALKGYLGLAV